MDNEKFSIPNLVELTNTIVEFITYINEPDMINLHDSDFKAFESHLENKFEKFSLDYLSIFKMLIKKDGREDNIMKLFNIISTLKDVKSGAKDHETEFEKFKEQQAQEYIYSKYQGGKEEFEKKLIKKAKKQNKKKVI
jgi:hypothetical protein